MSLRTVLACGAAAVATLRRSAGRSCRWRFLELAARRSQRRAQRARAGQRGLRRAQARADQHRGVHLRAAAAIEADRPLTPLLRSHGRAGDRLQVRLLDQVHQLGVGRLVLLGPERARQAGAAHRVPGHLQRAGRDARRRQQQLRRRAERREVADRPCPARDRHPEEHDLLHQLVGTARLRRPRLHEDRRARSRHRLRLRPEPRQPQDHRVGRHDAGRRGDRAGRARRQPRLVLRPLRGARVLGRELRHHESRPRRRRRAGLPASGGVGVQRHGLPRSLGTDGRPVQGGAVRGDQPALHVVAALSAVPDAGAPAECDRRAAEHLRGLAGRERVVDATRSRRTSWPRSASCFRKCR